MFGVFFTNDLLISDIKMPSDNAPIVWIGDPDLPGVEIRELSVNIPKCTTVLAEEHFEGEQSISDSNSEGEADFPGLEERDISVNIRKYIGKCTNVSLEEQVQDEESTVSAEENCEDEQGIANSSMESVNLILPTPLNCPVPLVAEDTVRDSASDCGPLLDLSDTEVEAKMERFGNLKVTDPVAQSDEVSDKNYQSRGWLQNWPIDMADSIDESSPDSPDIPDSGFDGVPQVEKHRNYKFRTRPRKMANNLQESSSEDLFVES